MTRFAGIASLTGILFSVLLIPSGRAQFKEIGPPPFSKAVAHQRMRALLDRVEPGNRQQTIDQLDSLVPWFRDVLDEELIAAWKRDGRDRLLLLMEPMSDPPVADAVMAFSWGNRTDTTFNPTYAPMFARLMARYPDSGREFLSDLLSDAGPRLSPLQEEAVCRILIDMPDIGNWEQNALRILPRYRGTAERLLQQDRQSTNEDKMYRAHMWLAQLRGERPRGERPVGERPRVTDVSTPHRRAVSSPTTDDRSGPILRPSPEASSRAAAAPPDPPAQALEAASLPRPAPAPNVYRGPMSGSLKCTGNPVPQNAEYVFRNLPPLPLELDYDRKLWEARLGPVENQGRRLILRNKSSGPQTECLVRWSVAP